MLYSAKRIKLPFDSNFKRVPPREPADRQENYLDRFDFHTLFSDAFVQDGRVWLIGPPFANLEKEIRACTFKWNWQDVTESVHFENCNRMSRASFPVGEKNGYLEISGPLGEWSLDVETPPFEFGGTHMLVTQQQDNRLEWIAYWAFFNVQVNKVDSIIIYDNCSELYSAERIDQVLARIPGLKNHLVVKWDTPYGVPGGPNSVWDSDFGQHISWEHCRRAFGSQAESVCIIDIDELPVSRSGKSLPDELHDSGKPALFFNRQPIRQYPNRSENFEGPRVHGDFSLGETRGAWLASKYVYSPSRLPENAQLLVHRISDLGDSQEASESVFAGHFDAIRVRWRHDEKSQVPTVSDPTKLQEPVELAIPLNTKFDEIQPLWFELEKTLAKVINSQASC